MLTSLLLSSLNAFSLFLPTCWLPSSIDSFIRMRSVSEAASGVPQSSHKPEKAPQVESSQKPEEAPQVEMNTTGSTVPTTEKAEASEYDYLNTESRLRNMIVFCACSRCMRQLIRKMGPRGGYLSVYPKWDPLRSHAGCQEAGYFGGRPGESHRRDAGSHLSSLSLSGTRTLWFAGGRG